MFLCYILRLITDDDLWEKKRETIKNEQKSTFESLLASFTVCVYFIIIITIIIIIVTMYEIYIF
jgi:hypothetical protein